MDYDIQGKLPPQQLELERAVLGAIMIESTAMGEVLNVLHADCFYLDTHKHIWNAALKLNRSNQPIDILTVTEQLQQDKKLLEVGGYLALVDLTNKVGSSGNIEYHALIIKEAYVKRRMISFLTSTIGKLFSDGEDCFEQLDALATELDSINSEINRIAQQPFSEQVFNRATEIKKAGQDHTYKTGIPCYIEAIDRQTMGFQKGNLVIIAARPAMGKTAFAIDIMRKQALQGHPVGVFSLEMSADELIDRMFASQSSVDLKQIRRGGMHKDEWQRFDTSILQLSELPITICDKGGLNINELVSIAKNWRLKYKIEALYIDYMQLINAGEKRWSREQVVSEVSRRLKQLAKDLRIPVVALAQLSRACEQRDNKRPMLSDLRESGGIEQDADVVCFPFRPEYYNEHDSPGLCEFDFAKYRNGKVGMVEIGFNGATQTFSEYNSEL